MLTNKEQEQAKIEKTCLENSEEQSLKDASLPAIARGFFEESSSNHESKEINSVKILDSMMFRGGFYCDVRNSDISSLTVKIDGEECLEKDKEKLISKEKFLELTIDNTTKLSDKQKEILAPYIEIAKDPGLGIREIHSLGITGDGVKMAIVDSPINFHIEYDNNIVENISDYHSNERAKLFGDDYAIAEMHGPAVASIAVGKNLGVAPGAELVYYSASANFTEKEKYYYDSYGKKILNTNDEDLLTKLVASRDTILMNCYTRSRVEAFEDIIKFNRENPKNKISVISFSWCACNTPYYSKYLELLKEAKEQEVLVISSVFNDEYPLGEGDSQTRIRLLATNRDLDSNLNMPSSYNPSYWYNGDAWKAFQKEKRFCNMILLGLPAGERAVASNNGPDVYRFEGKSGGLSWGIPWFAGVYALCKQAYPSMKPEIFLKKTIDTAYDKYYKSPDGDYSYKLVNPKGLLGIK